MNNKIKILLIIVFIVCIGSPLYAKILLQAADGISTHLISNKNCVNCGCSGYKYLTASMINTLIIAGLILLGGIWLYIIKRKIYLIIITVIISGLVAGSYFVTPYLSKSEKTIFEKSNKNISENIFSNQLGVHYDEFEPMEKTVNTDPAQITDSTTTASHFPTANKDEFCKVDNDEFSSVSNSAEFSSINESKSDSLFEESDGKVSKRINKTMIIEPAIIFLILGLISFLIKYEWFRKTRVFFLVGSLIYLGFIRGGCPCMISSFQNSVLMIFGVKVAWESLLFFLMLIPATYLFGKVWCGWLCHLGAFQELLHRSSKFNFISGKKAQKVLKMIQISVLILWILQLLFIRTNIFIVYDPFKVAFNLFASHWISWFFLTVLIISSLFIHRSFCRTLCPVGLILGWITKLPGAKRLEKEDTCIDCKLCSNACSYRALINEEQTTTLNQQDCIMCGECMSSCNKNALQVKRK